MKRKSLIQMVLSALFLALGLVLPFLTMQVPQIGSMLCPMHIPVLLCGFICGSPWGLAVGFIVPLLRSVWLGMPPIYTAIAMAFELAAYGFFSGFFHRILPKKKGFLWVSLVLSMIVGRVIWGAVSIFIYGLQEQAFSWKIFVASGFTNALPGIVLQLVLIPVLLLVLERAKLIPLRDNWKE